MFNSLLPETINVIQPSPFHKRSLIKLVRWHSLSRPEKRLLQTLILLMAYQLPTNLMFVVYVFIIFDPLSRMHLLFD